MCSLLEHTELHVRVVYLPAIQAMTIQSNAASESWTYRSAASPQTSFSATLPGTFCSHFFTFHRGPVISQPQCYLFFAHHSRSDPHRSMHHSDQSGRRKDGSSVSVIQNRPGCLMFPKHIMYCTKTGPSRQFWKGFGFKKSVKRAMTHPETCSLN